MEKMMTCDSKRTRQRHGVGRVDGPQVEPHQHLAAPRLGHRLPHDCGTNTQAIYHFMHVTNATLCAAVRISWI